MDGFGIGSEEEGPNIELVGIVLGVLQEGIAKTKQGEYSRFRLLCGVRLKPHLFVSVSVHKKGDKQHRLEKFMIRVVRFSPLVVPLSSPSFVLINNADDNSTSDSK